MLNLTNPLKPMTDSPEDPKKGDKPPAKRGRPRVKNRAKLQSERYDFRLTFTLKDQIESLRKNEESDPALYRRAVLMGASLLEANPDRFGGHEAQRSPRGSRESDRNTAVHLTPEESARIGFLRREGENNQQLIRRLLSIAAEAGSRTRKKREKTEAPNE